MGITPFSIQIPEETLDDLRARLARTRFPDQLEGAAWDYGTELDYLKRLCAYWQTDFDWRARERALNELDQYTVPIDGLNIHYIHVRSSHEHALPLILTHGWPGSIAEFTKVIGPLTQPEAQGGDPADAFHVVCPSLPGYGFSDAPTAPGFDIKRIAETNVQLMDALGYTRYGAQGGDWGSLSTSWMAALDPEHVCGIHLNMVLARRPKEGDPYEGVSEEEKNRLQDARRFMKEETGYQQIQGTKPQSLGYGLNDSPAGLAAWIAEKFRRWSDRGDESDPPFTMDELLTNITIYWVTGSITSSMRLYYETMKSGRFFGPPEEGIKVPTAFAVFPGELTRLPRAWAAKEYNVVRWTEMPSGGHFAAMEEPDLLVDDVRAFFRELR